MKNKIFDKMKEYGWNLESDDYKEFKRDYDWVWEFMCEIGNNLENKEEDMSSIDEEKLLFMCCFTTDFFKALDELDEKRGE